MRGFCRNLIGRASVVDYKVYIMDSWQGTIHKEISYVTLFVARVLETTLSLIIVRMPKSWVPSRLLQLGVF